jgi:hypothetical protein
MTKLLDEAISRVRKLPAPEQDVVAEVLLGIAEQPAQSLLTDEQLTEVRLALREAKDGQFATATELSDLWRKFGL